MLTPYDKRQQAAEARAHLARIQADTIARLPADLVTPSCDWDAALAHLTGPEAAS